MGAGGTAALSWAWTGGRDSRPHSHVPGQNAGLILSRGALQRAEELGCLRRA